MTQKIKKRKQNLWKVTTIFLAIVIIFMMIVPEIDKTINKEKPIEIGEHFCSITKKTPSWGNIQGEIIGTGYINFSTALNMSIDIVNKELIPNYLFFIYHPGCGACQRQIEYFGDTWQDYVDSGLTINCEEYW
ncbi:MAG TPA: hypothetical protein ENG87_05585 [Candidatus Pacearchaeota archaeon]|nr:hypothetical protein [Candidatus Pacearchaeota archaeon]HDZ60196.1 hypothetical protein [Candidatus Pacearchaeota archaeon]